MQSIFTYIKQFCDFYVEHVWILVTAHSDNPWRTNVKTCALLPNILANGPVVMTLGRRNKKMEKKKEATITSHKDVQISSNPLPLVVPRLSLCVVCNSIWTGQKIPVIFALLWSRIILLLLSYLFQSFSLVALASGSIFIPDLAGI